jgi:hypothetical protein
MGLYYWMGKKIAIVTCATEGYTYALPAMLRAVSRNIYRLQKLQTGEDYKVRVVMVGDANLASFKEEAISLLPPDVGVVVRTEAWTEGENYQKHAQLTIAQMRTRTFEEARRWGADFCWSLDSDVLPPDNALLCSLQMLEFDGGYYSVACCPYPSQGGGSFLTGRGTHYNPILPDFDLEEREVPKAVLAKWDKVSAQLAKDPENVSLQGERHALMKEIEKTCPPKYGGNIWKLNAEHGWRPRGWFDFAYPALGRGAVVPTDWCGFGATLMNSEALAAADFTGYDGSGTEDLFIVWKRWFPRRLLLCSIPHCPCDHVVRTGESRKIVHTFAYHEEHDVTKGHLRREFRPWYQHIPGEVYDPENNGVPDRGEQPEIESPTGQRKKK